MILVTERKLSKILSFYRELTNQRDMNSYSLFISVFHLAMRRETLSLFSVSEDRKFIGIRIFKESLFLIKLQDHRVFK